MRFLTAVLVLACSTAAALANDHEAFDAILRHRVSDDGLVDYAAIKQHDAAKLTAYLDELAKRDATNLPRAESLAYHINLYNATMIQAVIERLAPVILSATAAPSPTVKPVSTPAPPTGHARAIVPAAHSQPPAQDKAAPVDLDRLDEFSGGNAERFQELVSL